MGTGHVPTVRVPRNGHGEEDQLHTTESALRFAENVVGFTWWTVKAAAAINSRSRTPGQMEVQHTE